MTSFHDHDLQMEMKGEPVTGDPKNVHLKSYTK